MPVAAAADTATGGALTKPLAAIKQALSGLVDDGTLTQEQADTVAETLSESDALWPATVASVGTQGCAAASTCPSPPERWT